MVKALDTQLSTSDFFVTCSSLLICAPGKAGHKAPQEEAWWQVPTGWANSPSGRTLSGFQPIYEQSAARTVREQQEKRSCGWSHQPLKIEQLRIRAANALLLTKARNRPTYGEQRYET